MSETEKKASAGNGWLGTWVFIFTALYFHLSSGGMQALLSVYAMIFLAVGILIAALLIDFPAQLLQLDIARRVSAGATADDTERAAGKTAAIATFVKAGQVIFAFVATKYLFGWFYLTALVD